MKRYAALAAVAVTLLAVLPRSGAQAQTPQTCNSLEVLILLDESGSIDTNDPRNRRIDATKEYLANLRANQQVDISVALAGFAATFRPYSDGFLDLDTDADRLHLLVEEFADRHVDYEWDRDEYRWHTDYIEAFRGILDMPWSSDCRRTVWFSDGQHDLDHRARGDLLLPRSYDTLQRDLSDRGNLSDVEGLLIPAICGTEASRSQINPRYFGLAEQFDSAQVPAFEIRLFYLEGDQPYGDTLRLFELLNEKGCGTLEFDHRPVADMDSLSDDLLFNAACTSLSGTALDPASLTVRSGEGVVWNGDLPSGIPPELVESVTLLAGPGRAELRTGHEPAVLDVSNPSVVRLVLEFDSEHRFTSPVVRGGRMEQVCGSVDFGPPDLTAAAVTSPAMAGQPLEFSLTTGSVQEDPRPLSPEERNRVTVRRDGRPVDGVRWTPEGNLQDPAAPEPGAHTYQFELGSTASGEPGTASVAVQVEGVTLDAQTTTSRAVAGDPVEFAVEADNRPLTPEQQDDMVVYRDGEELDAVWTEDGTIQDPVAPAPGAHTYQFELQSGAPSGWVRSTVVVEVDQLPFEAELLTSPVLAGRPVEFAVEADNRPLTPEQQDDIVVYRDGEELDAVWTEDGTLRVPASSEPGIHVYRFELREGEQVGWVTDSFQVQADPQPPGPVMELDHARLAPLVGRDLTVPVKVDDTPGCLELDTSTEVDGGDGERVPATVAFADHDPIWCSDADGSKPTELEVELDRQVNTDQGMTVRYVSVSVEGERQPLAISVPGPIDRERNRTLETILSALLLLLMFTLLWLALFAINRRAGRLPRLPNTRYAEFTVAGDGQTKIGEEDHRLPMWSAGRIGAGPLQAVRKTPFWRIWRPPYAELSLSGAHSVAVMDGDTMTELPARHHRIGHKDRLHESIVLIEEGGSRGAVMAGVGGDAPSGQQLTEVVRTALARVKDRGFR